MKYEIMKPSGAAWLGDIPSTWDCKKIGSLFKQRNTKVSDKDYPALSVSKAGVTPQLETAVKTDNGDNRKLVKTGDFVVNSRSDRKGSCGVSHLDGSVSLINIVLTPRQEWNRKYVHYLMRSQTFSEEYYRYGRGIVADLWTTGYSEMKNICIPVPPREEQDQIVRYLDWQVSKINKLISAKKKEIKQLKLCRQTLIDTAVTKGIDNAPLKKSGTHWIEQIPEHWEIVYGKQLFSERKDKAFPDDEQLTASQKYGIIPQKKFMEIEGRRLTVVLTGNDILKHVGRGDFVISMRSFQGGLEYSEQSGKISSAYVMIIPNREKVYDGFYKWLLKSTPYIKALRGTSDLVRDGQALRFSNFAKVRLPQLPIQEQQRIAEYIDCKTCEIDAVLPKIESEIEALYELCNRIISDVVTGQIDVRGVDIPEYEYTEEMIDDVTDDAEESPEVDEND